MVLREVERIWQAIVERPDLPWPALVRHRCDERNAAHAMHV